MKTRSPVLAILTWPFSHWNFLPWRPRSDVVSAIPASLLEPNPGPEKTVVGCMSKMRECPFSRSLSLTSPSEAVISLTSCAVTSVSLLCGYAFALLSDLLSTLSDLVVSLSLNSSSCLCARRRTREIDSRSALSPDSPTAFYQSTSIRQKCQEGFVSAWSICAFLASFVQVDSVSELAVEFRLQLGHFFLRRLQLLFALVQDLLLLRDLVLNLLLNRVRVD